MRRILPSQERRIQLDVSLAIVNIVLLLIFFFLATGSLMNAPTYGVDLSETEELPIEILPKPILILDRAGQMSLDSLPIESDALAAAVDGAPLLHVLIDRVAPAQGLVDLLTRPELDATEVKLVTIRTRGAEP